MVRINSKRRRRSKSDGLGRVSRRSVAGLACLLGLAAVGTANAQTWNGSVSGNWSDAGNWTGGAPAATGSTLTFPAGAPNSTSSSTSNNDNAVTSVAGIIFSNAPTGDVTLSGSALTLSGNITASTGTANAHTVQNDLVLATGGSRNISPSAGTITLSGVVSGGGNLAKAGGTTTVILSNDNNTFTGQVQINSGTVRISSIADTGVASAAGAGSSLRMGSGNTTTVLEYVGAGNTTNRQLTLGLNTTAGTGGATITQNGTGALVFTNSVFTTGSAPTVTNLRNLTLNGTNSGANEIQGVIADNGTITVGLIKSGTGAWAVNGANTFTGRVVVQQGTLNVNTLADEGVASSLGQGVAANASIQVGNGGSGGTLNHNGGDTSTNRQIQIGQTGTGVGGASIAQTTAGTTLTWTNATFNVAAATTSNRNISFNGNGNQQVNGVIVDNTGAALQVSKNNLGTLTLVNNASTYTGATLINQGTVVAETIGDSGVNSALGAGSLVRLGNGGSSGTLNYIGATASTNRDVQIGATATGTGGGTINSNGAAGSVLTFSNAAFNTADTTATVARQISFSGTQSGVVSGVIQDNNTTGGGLVNVQKNGGGTWTFDGANSYTGTTNVLAGRLNINGDQSAATGNVTVNAGGSLGGIGTVGGLITINADGTLTPGTSPGVLTAANGLTLASGSVFEFELFGNTSVGRGLNFDGIDVTGGALTIESGVTSQLVFDGDTTVDFNDAFWDTNQEWLVFENANAPTFASTSIFDTIDFTGDSLFNPASALTGSFSFEQRGNNVFLNYTAVAIPEPTTSAVLALGCVTIIAARYRRRTKAAQVATV